VQSNEKEVIGLKRAFFVVKNKKSFHILIYITLVLLKSLLK